MHSYETGIGQWVVKYRFWLIAANMLFLIASALGISRLVVNNDLRIFFSPENPQLQALEALENTYTKADNVLFILAPKDGKVFTSDTLSAVETLTEALWKTPYSSRVDSISNFQHTTVEEDDLIVEDLVADAKSLSKEDFSRIKNIALSEPQLVNRLISPSGHVTGINVNILKPGKSNNEVVEVGNFVRDLAHNFRQEHPQIDLYLTGMVMMDNAYGEVAQDDMGTLVPIMFLALIVITGLALRSLTGTFVTLIIILFSTLTGMGLAGWLGISFNAASANAPTIILTLAVADSVHLLTSMFHQIHLSKSKEEAIANALAENLKPVFLTSITTVIGFLTMNFSDAPPFRDLGNMVALGVTAAFFYSILFLPPLVTVLPIGVKARVEPGCEYDYECCSCDRLADIVTRYRNPLFWGILIAVGIVTAGVFRIELNDNFSKYFDDSYEIRNAMDFMDENLTGMDVIEYSLKAGESGGINDPEYLKIVEDFANWYRKQPNVVHVSAITDTMKRLNKNMHNNDPAWYRIPDRRDLAAQYLLLYEMSLPFGLDLNNMINVDKSATRLIVSLKAMTTQEQRAMDERAVAWLKANAPKEMLTVGSGLTIIWAHLSDRNIKSMLIASFGALILISVALIFALRSFKMGVISLLPNLAPATMAFGLWGLLVGRVGLGLSVIVSMTLGIVVDDTIHFLSSYLRARREKNLGSIAAVRYSFNTVGTAMWITTLSLVVGFMILSLSGYKMNADMGLMSAITIVLALAMDFLLLPTLLIKVEGSKYEKNNTCDDPACNTLSPAGKG
ncbi:MAG: MMPL family transporter [Deltaproteobacteria bacterium]|nr:MMPL family transporter [Deltaproteobacteria bacterium]